MGSKKKIMICGSMSFAKQMLELQTQLQNRGFEVFVPCDTDVHVSKPGFNDKLEENHKHVLENDVMRKCFDLLAKSDAVVFLNLPKNGIEGYMGASSLMEIALAFYLKKKIYLMYPYPDFHKHRWAHEIAAFKPTVLNGDINKI